MLENPQLQAIIIDDCPEQLLIMSTKLQSIYGSEVTIKTERDPHKALQDIFENNGNNAIIVDCNMPEMTGKDVYNRLKYKRVSTPIIFISEDKRVLEEEYEKIHDTALIWEKKFDCQISLSKFAKSLKKVMIDHHDRVQSHMMGLDIKGLIKVTNNMITEQAIINKSLNDMLTRDDLRIIENTKSIEQIKNNIDISSETIKVLDDSWGQRKDICACHIAANKPSQTQKDGRGSADNFYGKAGELLVKVTESKVNKILFKIFFYTFLLGALLGVNIFDEKLKSLLFPKEVKSIIKVIKQK